MPKEYKKDIKVYHIIPYDVIVKDFYKFINKDNTWSDIRYDDRSHNTYDFYYISESNIQDYVSTIDPKFRQLLGYPSITGVGAMTAFDITTTPGTFPNTSNGAQPSFKDSGQIPLGNGILEVLTGAYNSLLGSGAQLFSNILGMGPTNNNNPWWSFYNGMQNMMSGNAFSTQATEIGRAHV